MGNNGHTDAPPLPATCAGPLEGECTNKAIGAIFIGVLVADDDPTPRSLVQLHTALAAAPVCALHKDTATEWMTDLVGHSMPEAEGLSKLEKALVRRMLHKSVHITLELIVEGRLIV